MERAQGHLSWDRVELGLSVRTARPKIWNKRQGVNYVSACCQNKFYDFFNLVIKEYEIFFYTAHARLGGCHKLIRPPLKEQNGFPYKFYMELFFS